MYFVLVTDNGKEVKIPFEQLVAAIMWIATEGDADGDISVERKERILKLKELATLYDRPPS